MWARRPTRWELRGSRRSGAFSPWLAKKSVDFVLIGGDTFEHDGIAKQVIDSILDLLGGFDSAVYVIPGNHDPWMPGSIWNHALGRCRRSVHILRESIPVAIPSGTLFACPLTARWSTDDPTRWMQQAEGEGIRIGSSEFSSWDLGARSTSRRSR